MPHSKDLSHLLSEEAKRRKDSLLKSAFKYFAMPDMVFLGGGLPLSDYFPWETITASSPAPPFANGIAAKPTDESNTTSVEVTKVPAGGKDIPLSRSLQYGTTVGQPELISFIKEHTEMIHKVPYDDWDVTATIGNTQAWDAVLRTLCDAGDTILVEQFSFPSSLEAANAQKVQFAPVAMDTEGIIPSALAHQMDNWPQDVKKPKLLYTIPTGQNPTGSCLSAERRKEIYKIAQKHDFIIIEDEPYYFLQMEPYTPEKGSRDSKGAHTHQEFIDALMTSFIKLDVDGRVLRLDSFSKVLAPGVRLGWIVGQKQLLERFLRIHEVTVQTPSGFSQSLVNGTLQRWGQSGFLDWLMGLRHEYTVKRDVAVDTVLSHFPEKVIHITPPTAGMFFTVQIDASQHPKYESEFQRDPRKVEQAVYERALEDGCLMIPGSWFEVINEKFDLDLGEEAAHTIFFRGTYAAVPLDKLALGLQRFGKAVTEEFGL